MSDTTNAAGTRPYVRYTPSVEVIEDGEQEAIDGIIETMSKESQATEERFGRAVRTSHAKSHGLLKGELRVPDGLPEALRQGLFAHAAAYPVIARLATVPGEFLDDTKVSSPRGIALKILGVDGARLPGHDAATQDLLFDTGKVFPAPGPKGFLATIKMIQKASPGNETLKQIVSVSSRAANAVLHAVGSDSPNLDFFGHPKRMPLAEDYYTQAPCRYGDYIAKFRLRPVTPSLAGRGEDSIDLGDDENALRTITVDHFRREGVEYEVGVQLCTDLGKMPVENAHTEWLEDDSPFIPVARLVFQAQDAFTEARRQFVDEQLSFCISHSLEAHRPLGGLNRARLKAYPVMSALRRRHNEQPLAEPASIGQLPD